MRRSSPVKSTRNKGHTVRMKTLLQKKWGSPKHEILQTTMFLGFHGGLSGVFPIPLNHRRVQLTAFFFQGLCWQKRRSQKRTGKLQIDARFVFNATTLSDNFTSAVASATRLRQRDLAEAKAACNRPSIPIGAPALSCFQLTGLLPTECQNLRAFQDKGTACFWHREPKRSPPTLL